MGTRLAVLMKRLATHWHILIALALATVTALALRGLFSGAEEGSTGAKFIGVALETCRFIGDLFMRGLKMIIVPLIVTAVVSGITGMKGVEGFGRLGLKTVAFYVCSSFAAITMGLVVVNVVQPGLIDGAPNEAIRAAFSDTEAAAGEADRGKVEEAGKARGERLSRNLQSDAAGERGGCCERQRANAGSNLLQYPFCHRGDTASR